MKNDIKNEIWGGTFDSPNVYDEYGCEVCQVFPATDSADGDDGLSERISLIGAAPEMLALLEQNLEAWEGEEDSVQEEHAELITATRAAIDKARQPVTEEIED